jgi:hypothetical protein
VPLVSIYTIFPPLLGIMYILFIKGKDDIISILVIMAYLLLYEINFSLTPFTTLIIFYILNHFLHGIFPKIFDCEKCLYLIHITIAYIGYFVLMYIFSLATNTPYISIHYTVLIYYILLEFIISLLVIDNE